MTIKEPTTLPIRSSRHSSSASSSGARLVTLAPPVSNPVDVTDHALITFLCVKAPSPFIDCCLQPAVRTSVRTIPKRQRGLWAKAGSQAGSSIGEEPLSCPSCVFSSRVLRCRPRYRRAAGDAGNDDDDYQQEEDPAGPSGQRDGGWGTSAFALPRGQPRSALGRGDGSEQGDDGSDAASQSTRGPPGICERFLLADFCAHLRVSFSARAGFCAVLWDVWRRPAPAGSRRRSHSHVAPHGLPRNNRVSTTSPSVLGGAS